MPLELIGWVAHQVESELIGRRDVAFDIEAINTTARIHEEAGFDTALVGYFSDAPDGFMVVAQAASVTKNLRFLIAHRPGFVAPTVAARKFASLDHLTGGRASVHFIAGASAAEQAMDGDYVDHDGRYDRMGEYIDLLNLTWTQSEAFDFDGAFYRVEAAHSRIPCLQSPRIPLFGGGGSPASIAVLAPRVDVFMLWGEPLANCAAFMERVRAATGDQRTSPISFSVSTRPILGATQDLAWERAHAILERVRDANRDDAVRTAENAGSRRLLDAAQAGELHDSCLWTPLAAAIGGHSNSMALVGTPETVANALLEYYKLGATRLLIRGWDPLPDAQDYGRELIPLLRERVAEHDRLTGA